MAFHFEVTVGQHVYKYDELEAAFAVAKQNSVPAITQVFTGTITDNGAQPPVVSDATFSQTVNVPV